MDQIDRKLNDFYGKNDITLGDLYELVLKYVGKMLPNI